MLVTDAQVDDSPSLERDRGGWKVKHCAQGRPPPAGLARGPELARGGAGPGPSRARGAGSPRRRRLQGSAG